MGCKMLLRVGLFADSNGAQIEAVGSQSGKTSKKVRLVWLLGVPGTAQDRVRQAGCGAGVHARQVHAAGCQAGRRAERVLLMAGPSLVHRLGLQSSCCLFRSRSRRPASSQTRPRSSESLAMRWRVCFHVCQPGSLQTSQA